MSESNEINVKDFQNRLFNYLINYLISNRKNRIAKSVTLHINPEVYQEFVKTLSLLGYPQYQTCGLLVEAFMQYFIDNYRPKGMIQTTLFYKPQINVNVQQKMEVNIAQKLELKIIQKNLANILEALEKKQGYQDFYLSKLREILPKAIRLYEKTNNTEIQKLLERAEKYV